MRDDPDLGEHAQRESDCQRGEFSVRQQRDKSDRSMLCKSDSAPR
jgi:hypothetical protein